MADIAPSDPGVCENCTSVPTLLARRHPEFLRDGEYPAGTNFSRRTALYENSPPPSRQPLARFRRIASHAADSIDTATDSFSSAPGQEHMKPVQSPPTR
jgi:hypothetical protein